MCRRKNKCIHTIKSFDRPSQAAFCDKLKHGHQFCYASGEYSWISDCVLRCAWLGVLQNERPAQRADQRSDRISSIRNE